MNVGCRRAYTDVCRPFFEDTILLNQSLLTPEGNYERVLDLVPDDG